MNAVFFDSFTLSHMPGRVSYGVTELSECGLAMLSAGVAQRCRADFYCKAGNLAVISLGANNVHSKIR